MNIEDARKKSKFKEALLIEVTIPCISWFSMALIETMTMGREMFNWHIYPDPSSLLRETKAGPQVV